MVAAEETRFRCVLVESQVPMRVSVSPQNDILMLFSRTLAFGLINNTLHRERLDRRCPCACFPGNNPPMDRSIIHSWENDTAMDNSIERLL